MSKINIKHTGEVLHGEVRLPASKSLSNRALIIQAIANQGNFIRNLSKARDTVLLKKLLSQTDPKLDCEMAGTTLRFLMAHFASKPGKEVILTGSERLLVRPVKALADALINLGAEIEYQRNPGFPPLKITGAPLDGGEVNITGSISSQFISALAMVAPNFKKGLTINIEGKLVSEPYLHMTMDLMRYFDADVAYKNGQMRIGHKIYIMCSYTVESDWSSASFFYALLALSEQGELRLKRLSLNSSQGDVRCAELFEMFGVHSEQENKTIKLLKTEASNQPLELDLMGNPDLAQPIAVVIAAQKRKAVLTGLQTLQLKESERLTALKAELEKLRVDVKIENNRTLHIDGSNFSPNSVDIETHNDHRMAMAFAPLVVKCPELTIKQPQVVDKSFPDFWKQLGSIEGITLA